MEGGLALASYAMAGSARETAVVENSDPNQIHPLTVMAAKAAIHDKHPRARY